MKRIATICFVIAFALTLSESVGAKVRIGAQTETLKPAPLGKIYKGPFLEEPKTIKFGNPATPLAGTKETLKTYDASAEEGHLFPMPINQLQTVEFQDGSTNTWAGYGCRFTTTLENPHLDSVTVWFVADSVASVLYTDGTSQLNGIQVAVVKQRLDDNGFPLPDLGETGSEWNNFDSNHKLIPRSSIKIDSVDHSAINRKKVSFITGGKPLSLPEQDFVVYINTRILYGDGQGGLEYDIRNNITTFGDSINLIDNLPEEVDPEVNRTYWIAFSDDAATYSTNTYSYGVRENPDDPDSPLVEAYFPNLYMIAHVRNPVGVTSVDDEKLEANGLAQNYPNPFNPSTVIKYSVANAGTATLKVYNALGSEVASLVNGFVSQGEHSVNFDASGLPTGTYYYTLKSGDFTKTKHMVLSK